MTKLIQEKKSGKESILDKTNAVSREITENSFPQLTEDLRLQYRTQELPHKQIYENKQIKQKKVNPIKIKPLTFMSTMKNYRYTTSKKRATSKELNQLRI